MSHWARFDTYAGYIVAGRPTPGSRIPQAALANPRIAEALAQGEGLSFMDEHRERVQAEQGIRKVVHNGKAYEDYTLPELHNLRVEAGGNEVYSRLKASWEERGKPPRKATR